MAFPIIPVGVIAISAVVASTIRLSTAVRLAEDGAIGAARAVKRGTKNVVRATRVEYNARWLAKLHANVQREAERARTLSDEEVAQLIADQEAVQARFEELLAQRSESTYYARRAKAEAKVARREAAARGE